MALPNAAKSDDLERLFPSQLRDAEEKLVDARRKAADPSQDLRREKVGIACSGGGIRSATFCLGFFQAVAKAGLLPKVDYISTISGGGYFGSFLGSLFVHSQSPGSANPNPHYASAVLSDTQSDPIKWLRQHGRYIAPNGPADYGNIIATFVRNWAAVQFVTGVAFLFLFFLLIEARSLLYFASPIADTLVRFSAFADGRYWHWSPAVCLPLLVLVLFTVPLGIAFWLTQYLGTAKSRTAQSLLGGIRANHPLYALMLLVLTAGAALYVPTTIGLGSREAILLAILLLETGLAVTFWIAAEFVVSSKIKSAPPSAVSTGVAQRQAMVRNLLTDNLASTLEGAAILAAIAFFDSAAQSAYSLVSEFGAGVSPTIWGVAAAIAPFVHRLGPLLRSSQKAGDGISWWTLLELAGWILYGIAIIGWGTLAYAIAFRGASPDWTTHHNTVCITSGVFLALTLVLNWLTGRTMTFPNLSSLQGFYSGRLRRAYLGAANPTRQTVGKASSTRPNAYKSLDKSIRRDVVGDDMPWSEYRPHEFGGPLHLLGVTVNHTVDTGSDLELRDRKGFLMTVGPAGLSANESSHALWDGDGILPIPGVTGNEFGSTRRVVESLSLSRWVAVSGAAFSTGLGARTKTGISLLMALANVRLGYWWQAHDDGDRDVGWFMKMFRAQYYLLVDEFFARFPGSERAEWYLTDGGHSENTAAYELVRRRIPIVVVLDNGADPDYTFEDFGNLVRRVRIDFGVEIVEWNEAERTGAANSPALGALIGSLEDLGRMPIAPPSKFRVSKRAVALFHVDHRNPDARTLLVLVKPTLVGDEPRDVTYYATDHSAFPQEPTADQFFDEPQWESYRQLGEHIGAKLLQQYLLTPLVRHNVQT